MAIVKPFKGMRYSEKAGEINKLVCPPYDIISDIERKQFLNTNPYNVIRLELPRQGEDVYKTAADTLKAWEEEGILTPEEENSFYIYEEQFKVNDQSFSLKGVIGRVKLTDFEKGVVIPHENTLSAAKEDRFNLMCATGCNFSQVYCLFPDENKKVTEEMNSISSLVPIHRFEDGDGVTHTLWKTADTKKLEALFKDKCLYIADGHHRYETGLRYRNEMRKNGASQDSGSEYIMMMLVPLECEGLVVFPTHRIVHSLKTFELRTLILNCREFFHVGEMSSSASLERNMKQEYENGKICFGLYCEGRFYLLTLKSSALEDHCLKDIDPSLRELDVTVLHSLILENILGIDKENLANQTNLKYTRDIDEAVSEVDGNADCAFILNPTKVSQIAQVGNAGQKMPQKSTYFYPKLITGLVINKIKE